MYASSNAHRWIPTLIDLLKARPWLAMPLLLIWPVLFAAIVTSLPLQETPVNITAPQAGDVLQGMVSINGTSAVANFRSVEVDFAYQTDPTNTWFMIQQTTTPVTKGLLAKWDTTTISDGDYKLRIQVILQNGQVLENEVARLRVRNYTQVETTMPQDNNKKIGKPSTAQTPTVLADFQPELVYPTALPTNPAQLTLAHLKTGAVQGVGMVFAGLVVAGMYLGIRALFHR